MGGFDEKQVSMLLHGSACLRAEQLRWKRREEEEEEEEEEEDEEVER